MKMKMKVLFVTSLMLMFASCSKFKNSYKTYTCLISQTGTKDPTVKILGKNKIGTIVWTRVGIGEYVGTLSGAFPQEKTFFQISTGVSGGIEHFARWWAADKILINSSVGGLYSDSAMDNVSFEIRVYK
jgi:hypothetical protein